MRMGFKFHRLSPIYKSYISRISSQPHRKPRPIYILQNPNFNIPSRWHGGHSHDHHRLQPDSKEGEKIFRLGLAADIGLASGKALTGYLTGSTAIIADAAHSVSDVVLSSIALLSFKASKVPKDKEHPYGHGKFETLGALGISCMLLATSGGIAWHAFEVLRGLLLTAPDIANQALIQVHEHGHHNSGHHHGIDMDHPILALNMTLVSIAVKEGYQSNLKSTNQALNMTLASIAVKEGLYWITKQAGERQGSGLMKANAWHHRADAVSSVVALIGVGGSILGVKLLDPLAGLVVSGMILKAGLETGYQSVLELVDAAIPAQQLDPIKQTILKVEGVKGCHRLRGRRAGSSIYLDVHIVVDPFLSVSTAHDIGENVRHQIHRSHPEVAEVFIHIDPAVSQFWPSLMDQQENPREMAHEDITETSDDKEVEAIVSNILSTKFPEILSVEQITRHSLLGKTLLQIEVSMPSDFLIRDATRIAEAAEKEILKAAANVSEVNLQLRLGRPVSQL